MEYDVIIGLEIHAELKTVSKMFCSCDNDPNGKEPNTNVCPICMGHPGTLPYPNEQAVEWTVLIGQALHCHINNISKFDRKNYYYPDLPKGYQISQYDLPMVYQGYMIIGGEKALITRIHLEEDTGKLTHPTGSRATLVDFNRAGTPLVEMVTEPVFRDGETAKKFCQRYQQILRYLGVSDADMEKGHMRCEANVSLQEKDKWTYEEYQAGISPKEGYELNPKVELKNINSFKAVEKAINYEIERQKKAFMSGEELVQETRGWDENKAKTIRQRIKETSADYRYFPEPDIPPLRFSPEWMKRIKAGLSEMPPEKIERFKEQYLFDDETAEILVSDKAIANFTEEVISELRAWVEADTGEWKPHQKKLSKLAANWLTSELFKYLRSDNKSIKDTRITPENFAELITLVYEGKVNSSAGQKILELMYQNGGDPSQIMRTQGLEQMDDDGELESVIKEILQDNQAQVEQYKSGKESVLQFFVGQTMKATRGKANPQKVVELLKNLLA